ncbi:hypothetical protein [Persephonella sp.]|uniref:hypothetical protein n=1 Tax=Persephonella sp. TaxID=2060922 RepID=UPI00262B5498|nr:hypothetical protein [Persephonella sp.]
MKEKENFYQYIKNLLNKDLFCIKLLLIIGFFIFITGCENFYSKVYDKSIKEKNIHCVRISYQNPFIKTKIIKAFKEEGIKVQDNCPYTINVKAKFLSQCTSPQAKSIGADFDGFMRFDLLEKGKLVYRCQMDWKGKFSEDRVKDLIKKMKEDIGFK